MEAAFDVTLPSNASYETHPDNRTNSFTTELASEISLTGEWEVGLREIHYPRSWLTLDHGEGVMRLRRLAEEGEASQGGWTWTSQTLKPGYYGTAALLVKAMTKCLNRLNRPPALMYIHEERRMMIHVGSNSELHISAPLAGILGFSDGKNACMLPSGTNHSPRCSDFTRGVDALYIYSDLIRDKIIGHSLAPLLRTVPIEGNYNQMVYREYIKPLYAPISHNCFRTIEVNIRDSTGRAIPFTTGKLTIVLHLRRIKE
jgi:hypothetical protein